VSLVFNLCLGKTSVKRVVFAGPGRRELRTSGGDLVGTLHWRNGELRLEFEEYAAEIIADANFGGE
jgi:hypothetical protein